MQTNPIARRDLAHLIDRAQRRLNRPRLIARFHRLGPRFCSELIEYLDAVMGIGDELDAATSRALGWPPGPAAASASARHDRLVLLRLLEQHRRQRQQRSAALHRRGPAALLAIINGLSPAAIETADSFMSRATSLPRDAIRAAGVDRLVPPPIWRVR